MTAAEFLRQNFPEFADTTRYPPERINFWFAIAAKRLDKERWADNYDLGVQLLTAHFLTLQALDIEAADMGGVPGQNPGIMTSQGTGDISSQFDVQSTIVEGAGMYNGTTYGKQFYQLVQMTGIGAIQL